MPHSPANPDKLARLRRLAEAIVGSPPPPPPACSPAEAQQWLYNLRVHEVMLELQSEELRRARRELARNQPAKNHATERQALARELHDQVGPKLTALNLNLNTLHAWLATVPATTEPVMAALAQSLKLVEETAQCLQAVMINLRPPGLDDYGLVTALQWYSAEFSAQANFSISVQGDEPSPRLPAPVEYALFRIAQEALTNALKHSQASQVVIALAADRGLIRLTVTDNGQGFDPAPQPPAKTRQGRGVANMRERAEAVGGRCYLKSQPGQGTQVIVEIPL